jgi:hypothetical protein
LTAPLTVDFVPRVHGYDPADYDFQRVVAHILAVPDLQRIDGGDYPLFTRETDQSTRYHTLFYDAFHTKMGDLYRRFAAHMAKRIFGDTEVYHQAVPTFRVQFPNNFGVGEMHKDADYHHQNGEINCWVPLTPVWGANSIWVEKTRGGYNYQPWNLKPGQLLVFDSVNWMHGNIRNSTGRARVSFDFRLLPADKYADTGAKSVHVGRRMCLGDYWEGEPNG